MNWKNGVAMVNEEKLHSLNSFYFIKVVVLVVG